VAFFVILRESKKTRTADNVKQPLSHTNVTYYSQYAT